jgi:AbrB family looped-hinge helix DNA binding protein
MATRKQGVREAPQSGEVQEEATCVEVRVGPQGRIVIPASLRRQLGIQPNDRLIARIEDGRLVLETRDSIVRRLQARFSHIPPEVSLVDELIAERREEARREAEEMEK